MEQMADSNHQEQPPTLQQNKFLPSPNRNFIILVTFTTMHCLLLDLIHWDSWKMECSMWLYLVSVMLFLCNEKMINSMFENRPVKVQKWRRLCTVLQCLLVLLFPASIYYVKMDPWFKVLICIGSGNLVVLIVVFHVALVELSEVTGNIAIELKHTSATKYCILNQVVPFCAMFVFFTSLDDPWRLLCSMLLCIDHLLLRVCMSNKSQLNSVQNHRAKANKLMIMSLGLIILPAVVLLFCEQAVWDGSLVKLPRIWHGMMSILFSNSNLNLEANEDAVSEKRT